MEKSTEGRLIDFVKDAFTKGYDEDKVRQIMLEHHVPEPEIHKVMEEAKAELAGIQKAMPEKEEVPVKERPVEHFTVEQEEAPQESSLTFLSVLRQKEGFYSMLLIIAGFAIMLGIYISRAFTTYEASSGLGLRIIRGLWPLSFPIAANIINFYLFRGNFRKYLVISLLILAVLLIMVVIFMFTT